MNYADVARRLRRLGCEEVPRRSGGSHRTWRNPATGHSTTVPDWGGKDLKPGLIHGAVRRLDLQWNDFTDALKGPDKR